MLTSTQVKKGKAFGFLLVSCRPFENDHKKLRPWAWRSNPPALGLSAKLDGKAPNWQPHGCTNCWSHSTHLECPFSWPGLLLETLIFCSLFTCYGLLSISFNFYVVSGSNSSLMCLDHGSLMSRKDQWRPDQNRKASQATVKSSWLQHAWNRLSNQALASLPHLDGLGTGQPFRCSESSQRPKIHPSCLASHIPPALVSVLGALEHAKGFVHLRKAGEQTKTLNEALPFSSLLPLLKRQNGKAS